MTDRQASDVLSENGPVAKLIKGFSPRIQQQEMADLIARTLAENGSLICEAGTGTGKTFAYLVPALLSGKKVIISTGTKHLQDQLYHRDLPVIRDALKRPVSIALLKGRANYVCLHRLEQAGGEGSFLTSKLQTQLSAIRAWSGKTVSGDTAEIYNVPEDSTLWPLVTSTTDNCLGQECPLYADCYVYKARKAANEADVLVVNHHLFMADLSLREGGFGEVLPGAEAVIFDEAHQLHDIASQFFGSSVTSRQCLDLARDLVVAYLRDASDMPDLQPAADRLEKSTRDFRLALGPAGQKVSWRQVMSTSPVKTALEGLLGALINLQMALKPAAERSRSLENCLKRVESLVARLKVFSEQDKTDESQDTAMIQWVETYQRAFALNVTPLEIADGFRTNRERYQCSWIFTSATLAVGNDFSYFSRRLGLDNAATHCWDSPFNYPHQACLYLPELNGEPNQKQYTEAVVNAALPVLKASRGRAFMLFTSHRALQEAAVLLAKQSGFTLLVQGEAPKPELLERFTLSPSAVLLGTSSFWEGVDVRGEALSCVIIDKLPFASMGEPVMQARLEALRKQGRNPFMEYQLPEAVIALKQGAGRLIRDNHDQGVLMICDPRLMSKHYGRIFLSSLPPMSRTRDLNKVKNFFK